MASVKDRKRTFPESQLNFPIERKLEPDRNRNVGGRSFYFFDFDDNVAFLNTTILIFHKYSGREVIFSTSQFSEHGRNVGIRGPYSDYEIRLDDRLGSFRRFRDLNLGMLQKFLKKKQAFEEDLLEALGQPDLVWKGPSWDTFYHATFNQRPIAIITARGHHPETIKCGIRLFKRHGYLPKEPNYLGVFPVSHPGTRCLLGDFAQTMSTARLKQKAIRRSVEEAFRRYGYNPHHRFGMSDDDTTNLDLIREEMVRMKEDFPKNSFYVIETNGDQYLKREIFSTHTRAEVIKSSQLNLF